MKQNWWKWACILLLVYTFSAGLFIPMAPGIIRVNPGIFSTGTAPFTLQVTGFNTRFLTYKSSLKAWLHHENSNICASSIRVKDEHHLELDFPQTLPSGQPVFDLHINNDGDGTLIMDNAITTTDTAISSLAQQCDVNVKATHENYFAFPFRYILYESIRNLFFHVPMWFAMIALVGWAVWCSIRFLSTSNLLYDTKAAEAVNTGLVFGLLGLITGSLWARVTWGQWWVDDVKLNGTAITMLAYLAYIVLRNAIVDEQKRARLAAVYSIFAFAMMIVLIGVLPRLQNTDSLHPGNGGNPAFSSYDLDNKLRMVFYAAVFGWILLGFWIYTLRVRIRHLYEKSELY